MPDRSRRSSDANTPQTVTGPQREPTDHTGGIGNAATQDQLSTQPSSGEPSFFQRIFGQSSVGAGDRESVTGASTAATPSSRTVAQDGALGRVAFSVAKHVHVLARGRGNEGAIDLNVWHVLDQAAKDGVKREAQVAYLLATAWHESGFGTTQFKRSEPLVEDHNAYRGRGANRYADNHVTGRQVTATSEAALDEKYWDQAYGGKLGNERGTDDASQYRGRGFVQLTGKDSYERMTKQLADEGFTYTHEGVTWGRDRPIDLVANPTHVNEVPALAARILVEGSMEGLFTGSALTAHVNDRKTDFKSARSVINGDVAENGGDIAKIADRFAQILKTAPGWASVTA